MLATKAILITMMSMNNYDIPMGTIDVDQAHCMAINVYHEARGEDYIGKIKVANVVNNRVEDHRFPNTHCGVIQAGKRDKKGNIVKDRCAFSWYCDGKSDKVVMTRTNGKPHFININSYREAVEVALMTMTGTYRDLTKGSNHYYNHNLVQPGMGRSLHFD